MAILRNKVLFFTTSPRNPIKMIPEIKLLKNKFINEKWNKETQIKYINELTDTNYFKGRGCANNLSLSARDRINRGPKSLGLVDVSPIIKVTEAGEDFINPVKSKDTLLTQLIKFQLPSPFHTEKKGSEGFFNIKPYLEIVRLISELDYLTTDEIKIYGLSMINYNQYNKIRDKICLFRLRQKEYKGRYRDLSNKEYIKSIESIYEDEISSIENSSVLFKGLNEINQFIEVKRNNLRGYADACIRYLEYTEIIEILKDNKRIVLNRVKNKKITEILSKTRRDPIYVKDLEKYKEYMYNPYNI